MIYCGVFCNSETTLAKILNLICCDFASSSGSGGGCGGGGSSGSSRGGGDDGEWWWWWLWWWLPDADCGLECLRVLVESKTTKKIKIHVSVT